MARARQRKAQPNEHTNPQQAWLVFKVAHETPGKCPWQRPLSCGGLALASHASLPTPRSGIADQHSDPKHKIITKHHTDVWFRRQLQDQPTVSSTTATKSAGRIMLPFPWQPELKLATEDLTTSVLKKRVKEVENSLLLCVALLVRDSDRGGETTGCV